MAGSQVTINGRIGVTAVQFDSPGKRYPVREDPKGCDAYYAASQTARSTMKRFISLHRVGS